MYKWHGGYTTQTAKINSMDKNHCSAHWADKARQSARRVQTTVTRDHVHHTQNQRICIKYPAVEPTNHTHDTLQEHNTKLIIMHTCMRQHNSERIIPLCVLRLRTYWVLQPCHERSESSYPPLESNYPPLESNYPPWSQVSSMNTGRDTLHLQEYILAARNESCMWSTAELILDFEICKTATTHVMIQSAASETCTLWFRSNARHWHSSR